MPAVFATSVPQQPPAPRGPPIMRGRNRLFRGLPRTTVTAGAACIVLLLLGGCSQGKAEPILGDLYTRAAQSGVQEDHPVVVIPGILGSRLVDPASGTTVWGAFAGDYARPDRRDGARLVALPMRPGVPLDGLDDDVEVDGALERVRINLLGLPVTLGAYADIIETLGAGGYRDQMLAAAGAVKYGSGHFTCFQYAYDWRRSNDETAASLYHYLLDRRAYVHAELVKRRGEDAPPPESIKFDVVAHSMGGLVARYMLRYGDELLPEEGPVPPPTWKGAALVNRLILVATPNAGSPDAVRQLVEGKDFGGGVAFWLPSAPAAVLGTLPSIYQLMPRPRHGTILDADGRAADVLDPAFWEDNQIGLLDPRQAKFLEWLLPDLSPRDRRAAAADHLRKCLDKAEKFHIAIDRPASPPPGVELHLFCGDAVETLQTLAVIGPGRVEPQSTAPGDGTVLRSSALMDERLGGDWTPRLRTPVDWTAVNFVFEDHLGITRSAGFSDEVLYLLLEAPRRGEMGSPAR